MKAWFLKLHRWVAFVFALPLVFVLGTALILSFEPGVVVSAITPGALTPSKIQALLREHDPNGLARDLTYRNNDKALSITTGRGKPGTLVDVATGRILAGPSALANLFVTARRMHERLLIDA